jgi:hypothetical protein
MSKLLSFGSYAIGTLVMAFGWLCALAQADAPTGDPRSAPLIVVFAIAFSSFALSAIFMKRAKMGHASADRLAISVLPVRHFRRVCALGESSM